MNSNRTNRKRVATRNQPTKRKPYVNKACHECKRRKVKCNGMSPCEKCVKYSAPCVYPPQIRFEPHGYLETDLPTSPCRLPDQQAETAVNSPSGSIGTSIPVTSRAAPSQPDGLSSASHAFASPPGKNVDSPEFCGPSSSEFTLNVVNGNLKAMGIPAAILGKSNVESEPRPNAPPRTLPRDPYMKLLDMEPLLDFKVEDAVDHINHWFDGTGSLYPVVSREQMLQNVHRVFGAIERARSDGMKTIGALVDVLSTDDTIKMKLILAVGRTCQRGGWNDLAQRLLQHTAEATEGLLWGANSLNNIQILILLAMYYYHLDDETRTGRIIGFAARLCLEMGLHRLAMLKSLASPGEQSAGLRTFWCVYMLERRTSLGQGIPFHIQDAHIDPSLFSMPENGPVMSALLDWTKLAGKTWQALNSQGEKEAEIQVEELDYLDYQITQWYQRLPDHLKLSSSQEGQEIKHIQVVLFLRRSHLQNLIYRPFLRSAARIAQHEKRAQAAATFAKEALQMLSDINAKTPFIQNCPVFFKHLLLTAFGNLLLAIVNASSIFGDNVKAEFNIALDLIRMLSGRSPLLMCLWRRLQGLRKLQEHLTSRSVGGSSASDPPQEASHASDTLFFDELFPVLPFEPGLFNAMEPLGEVFGSTMSRDQLNGFLDFSA